MKRIYQSNVSKDKGDCARATIATIFDMELNEVPDFLINHKKFNMSLAILDFFDDKGYDSGYITNFKNEQNPTLKQIAKYDGGINGYFYAIVKSQTYKGGLHAVIIDENLNVVHDPNPNQLCCNLNSVDIVQILTVSGFHIDTNGNFIKH